MLVSILILFFVTIWHTCAHNMGSVNRIIIIRGQSEML